MPRPEQLVLWSCRGPTQPYRWFPPPSCQPSPPAVFFAVPRAGVCPSPGPGGHTVPGTWHSARDQQLPRAQNGRVCLGGGHWREASRQAGRRALINYLISPLCLIYRLELPWPYASFVVPASLLCQPCFASSDLLLTQKNAPLLCIPPPPRHPKHEAIAGNSLSVLSSRSPPPPPRNCLPRQQTITVRFVAGWEFCL